MNNFVFIRIENNISRFIDKCKNKNIELLDIKYIDKNTAIIKVKKSDLDNIKLYNYYSNISIYKKTGIDYIKDKIINNKYLIIVFIICVFCMFFISNIIIKVNVIHNNKEIRSLINSELENLGIKKYCLKKKYNELENIKKIILNNNKEKVEWISITNVGMTYVVRVEERIITNLKKEDNYCNIISTKDALITNIYSDSGDILVNVNDIVKKGDTLISGNLTLNEETKGYACANGIIYGNVWYNTNITLNRTYIKRQYTGRSRYNIIINNKILRSNKFNNYHKKNIINNKYFTIYKELEYKNKKNIYSDKEGINKALSEVEKKFNTKLGNNGRIIKNRILKKNLSKDSINIELFLITEEIISKKEKLNMLDS